MKELTKFSFIFCLIVNSLQSQVQLGQELYGDEILDLFGEVDISADGSRMVVAAGVLNNSGYVRVYEYDTSNNTWKQLGNDILGEKPQSFFGNIISISGNGNRIAIQDSRYFSDTDGGFSELIRVYEFNGIDWLQIGQDFTGDGLRTFPFFSLSLSSDGNRLVIGRPVFPNTLFPGSDVIAYDYNGSNWVQVGQTIHGEAINIDQRRIEGNVGHSVEISPNGNHILVGLQNGTVNGIVQTGRVRVYENLNSGDWIKVGHDIVGEEGSQIGAALSISSDGNIIAFSAEFQRGNSILQYIKVFKYNHDKNEWGQLGSNIIGQLGSTISLSGDGQKIALGLPYNEVEGGYSRIYRFNNAINDWEQTCLDINVEITKNSNSAFNRISLSTDGRTLAIGETLADGPNGKTNDNIGRVRVFDVSTKVKGTVLFDIAENGCTSMTIPAANAQITITNDFETITTTTDNNGNYIEYLGGYGNYTISVAINGYSESKIHPIIDCEENIVNFCIPNNYFDTVTVDALSSASELEGTDLIHTVTLTGASTIIKTYTFLLRDQTTEFLTDYTTAIFSDNVTYNETLGLLIVPAGVSSFTITVSTINDPIFEEDEFYNISVGNITTTGTILNNDIIMNPTVGNETALEGTDLVHTINAGGVFTTDKTYSYSLIDNTTDKITDYGTVIFSDNIIATNNLITIPAGIENFTITIPTIDDDLDEQQEYYTITFDGISGTGTIQDNDGFPRYFTPNNDGLHDTWPFDLVENNTIYNNALIYIFNRYGKLLKEISSLSNGWDGTFNGEKMPEDDYWYRIVMPDGKIHVGHFTLKR